MRRPAIIVALLSLSFNLTAQNKGPLPPLTAHVEVQVINVDVVVTDTDGKPVMNLAKDDFQATWRETEVVSADPTYRTNYGKIHYLQYLVRDHPLIMPAFFAGLGIVFVRSMTAISATIFLVSISWTLITVKILENITELSLGPAAAFSVLVVVIVFAVIAGISWTLRVFRAPGAAMTSLLGG